MNEDKKKELLAKLKKFMEESGIEADIKAYISEERNKKMPVEGFDEHTGVGFKHQNCFGNYEGMDEPIECIKTGKYDSKVLDPMVLLEGDTLTTKYNHWAEKCGDASKAYRHLCKEHSLDFNDDIKEAFKRFPNETLQYLVVHGHYNKAYCDLLEHVCMQMHEVMIQCAHDKIRIIYEKLEKLEEMVISKATADVDFSDIDSLLNEPTEQSEVDELLKDEEDKDGRN